MADLNHDYVRPVLRIGPQSRMCEANVARRTSTTIMCGQCCVPDLNRDYVRSVWRVGSQPEDMSERMSERMSEDMSERMSKDMSERNLYKECRLVVNGLHPCSKFYNMRKMTSCETD